MADLRTRRSENVEGDFFVDATCIDCDTCRWMAPATFDRQGEQSRVHRQPEAPDERRRALMALAACPTASIGTLAKARDLPGALAAFPDPIAEGVFHCGFHAEDSFGATSYLIVRAGGNVLVDSPRFAGPLVRRLEELGGVRWLFLTHRDDVSAHEKYARHFGAQRILHAADVTDGTRAVEIQPTGHEPFALADDLTIIPTPGHTAGSACLLYDPREANGGAREAFLFSGDHVAWSESRGHVHAFRSACWYDWDVLRRSVERLLDYRFAWLLPGHGRRAHLPPDDMAGSLRRCLEWMS